MSTNLESTRRTYRDYLRETRRQNTQPVDDSAQTPNFNATMHDMNETEGAVERSSLTGERIEGKSKPLLDSDNSWSRVPYQVLLGKEFTNLKDALAFSINTWGAYIKTGTAKGSSVNDMPGAYIPPEWHDVNEAEAVGADPFMYGDVSITTGYTRSFFQDTRVGANEAINCFYQFNRDDDIVSPALVSDSTANYGLGRNYTDTTQRNQTVAYFSFGIPVFRNLVQFLRGAIHESLARVNAVGYDRNNAFNLGHIFGTVIGIVAFPVFIIPIRLFKVLANWAKLFHVNKYISFRSEMSSYYSFVDSILSHWLVATGIYGNGGRESIRDINKAASEDEKEERGLLVRLINALVPGFISTQSSLPPALAATGPSIYDIITLRSKIIGLSYRSPPKSVRESITKDQVRIANDTDENQYPVNMTEMGNADIGMVHTSRTRMGFEGNDSAEEGDNPFTQWIGENLLSPESDESSTSVWDYVKKAFKNASTSAKFTATGGTQFIGFRIEKGTGTSESFSNTSQPSPIGTFVNDKIKVAHKAVSLAKIAEAEAAIKDTSWAGIISNFFSGMVDAGKELFGIGAAIEAVNTASFIDIPDEYESSSYNKSFSISFQLRSPYGDIVSIYESIMIPLALILAGSLPRGAGTNSYQSPFHVKVYCPGRFSIPMGLIESLSITRGSSDFGWTYQNLPTSIDVSVNIKDLSAACFLTLRGEGLWDTIFGDDNAFTEYINVLAGVGLADRVSGLLQMQRRFQLLAHRFRNKYLNSGYWGMTIGDMAPFQIAGLFMSQNSIPH